MAWLEAVPKTDQATHAARLSEKRAKELSRIEKLREEKKDPDYWPFMPRCDAAYLLGYFFDVGPVLPGGMGNVWLTEEELHYWQENTGITLEHWETRFLKRLSKEYLAEATRATEAGVAAPWSDESTLDRAAVADNLRELLRMKRGR